MAAPGSVRAVLAGALAGLGVSPRSLRYRALPGGLNNDSFLVTADGGRWVVKLRSEALGPLLDVAAEAEVTAAAARAGIAPRVLACDAAAGVLVTEYRAGARALSAAEAREPANIARIAALLRRLHAVRAPVGAFGVERVARGYVEAVAGEEYKKIAPGRRSHIRWGDELLELARWYEARYPAAVLCHNDLAAANLLDDGELTLVDFEYAVLAAPILDLASLAVMNAYAERERAELVAAYGAPIAADELRRVARMVALLGWFWAAANEGRAAAPAVYARIRADLAAQLEAEAG